MFRVIACALLVLAALPAQAAGDEAIVKPIKTVVSSIRYGKDLAALRHFAAEAQGQSLLGDEWGKATPDQRKEFVELFHTLFAKMAFPKVRDNFKHLETVLYEPAKVEGDRAEVGSTLVILHPMKKQELKLRYQLVKEGGAWKLLDVAVLGDSMMKGIREDQVQPLLKEGGWGGLTKAMKDKVAELASVKLK